MLNNQSLQAVQNQLALFAAQGNFDAIMTTAFGSWLDWAKLQLLRQQWLSGNFSVIPDTQVLSQGELGAANGAYAASLDKIFVSSDFLAHASESQVTTLILEEVGHRLDQLLNGGVDSAGDEGEIFSRLVNGENLSASTLAALRAEDDRGIITVGGVGVAIEKQTYPGGIGNDTINGGSENDYISGLAGNDFLYGGIGIVGRPTGDDTIDAGTGNDYLVGYNGNDFLYGGAGNDQLYGGTGNDALYGGTGNDTLDGGVGNDIYIIDADVDSGTKTIIDSSGFDTLNFDSTTNKAITVNVAIPLIIPPPNSTVQTVAASVNVIISASSITNVYGGALGDKITGNSLNNILSGNGGNDSLRGAFGDDLLIGGSGNDTYIIDADVDFGTKTIDEATSGGIDSLDFRSSAIGIHLDLGDLATQALSTNVFLTRVGLQSIENVYGGSGNDSLRGNFGNDMLNGGSGNDDLSDGTGNDILDAGAGDDTLDGGDGNNTLYGGAGNDTLYGGGNNDMLYGGAGNDEFFSEIGHSMFYGGTGDDTYLIFDVGISVAIENSFEGNDQVNSGVSYVLGNGLENLWLFNSSGSLDTNGTGNNLNNEIVGNDGSNRLSGKVGNDTLEGQQGNDVYVIDADVDSGFDIIKEEVNGGIDSLDFRSTNTKGVTVNLAVATNQLVATGVNITLSSRSSSVVPAIEYVYGGALGDNITGNSLNNYFMGGAGNDTIRGGLGNEIYAIDADVDLGSDTIIELAAGGIDSLDFRSTTTKAITVNLATLTNQTIATGVNLIMPSGSIEYAYGGALGDNLTGNTLNNYFMGGAGNDTIRGGLGNEIYAIDADVDLGSDTIIELAAGGIDSLDFRSTTTKAISVNLSTLTNQTIATGVNLIMPSGSIEQVYGGALSDNLTGNSLNNYFIGGAGNDTLKGAAGSDTFSFGGAPRTSVLGIDTISDFTVGVDKIALSKATFTKFASTGMIGGNFMSVAVDAIASVQMAAIVYSRESGRLFYNTNEGIFEYGDNGGNFAVLTPIAPTIPGQIPLYPTLSDADFLIVA
jgi:Ca2+-binding RTX toxin-like protein